MVGLVLLKGITYWKSLGNTFLGCRGVIRGFLMPVHIVLFICNVFMVVFDAQR